LPIAGEREDEDYGGGNPNCRPICEFSGDSHQVLY
jgi:hypothetical protein